MDLEKVIKYLETQEKTEDMVTFVKELKLVNLETVKDFLENNEDGKKHLKSHTDAQVTKGIETFKEKTMPDLIEEKIKEKFPQETEAEKKMRQLEDNQKMLQDEIKRKDLLNKAISIANEKKLPLKLVDRFIGEDEEKTIANLEMFESVYNEAITSGVENKFKNNGRGDGGGSGEGEPGPDPEKMTDEEYFKFREKQNN